MLACDSAFLRILPLVGFAIGLCDLITSNTLFSLRLLNVAFLSLCASTLLAHANTCSLVTELMSQSDVSTPIISTIMSPSLKPLKICSLKCLS